MSSDRLAQLATKHQAARSAAFWSKARKFFWYVLGPLMGMIAVSLIVWQTGAGVVEYLTWQKGFSQ